MDTTALSAGNICYVDTIIEFNLSQFDWRKKIFVVIGPSMLREFLGQLTISSETSKRNKLTHNYFSFARSLNRVLYSHFPDNMRNRQKEDEKRNPDSNVSIRQQSELV